MVDSQNLKKDDICTSSYVAGDKDFSYMPYISQCPYQYMAINMFGWGIPENMMQNEVESH